VPKPRYFHREQLTHIRRSADWRRLFQVLSIEKDPTHSTEADWWGKSPFRPDEHTASFHMNDKGWYCHATHAVAPGRDKPGGGVVEQPDGTLRRVILSHLGRAVTAEQQQAHGKWWVYRGFNKRLELYGLDHLLLDPRAIEQVRATGRVLLVEGPFDVAKLVEAGIHNVVASLGAHLAGEQLARLDLIRRHLGAFRPLLWYDRDQAGQTAQNEALGLLRAAGWLADGFDWGVHFPSPRRGAVTLPVTVGDPCDLSVAQLRWLRAKGVV
jgi:hypothetical protein